MRGCWRATIHCAVAIAVAAHCLAQGTFQNLNFEDARIIPSGIPYQVSAADALPGWSCYLGTNQWGLVWYNALTLDSAAVGILSSTSPYIPAGLLSGQYCLSLQNGLIETDSKFTYVPASIAQTGQIPSDVQSLRFRASNPLSVSFAGTAIQMVVLRSDANYNLYGGDIRAMAGQTGELRITSYTHFNFLDRILLSTLPIPEPTGLALFMLGAGLRFFRARRFTPRKQG